MSKETPPLCTRCGLQPRAGRHNWCRSCQTAARKAKREAARLTKGVTNGVSKGDQRSVQGDPGAEKNPKGLETAPQLAQATEEKNPVTNAPGWRPLSRERVERDAKGKILARVKEVPVEPAAQPAEAVGLGLEELVKLMAGGIPTGPTSSAVARLVGAAEGFKAADFYRAIGSLFAVASDLRNRGDQRDPADLLPQLQRAELTVLRLKMLNGNADAVRGYLEAIRVAFDDVRGRMEIPGVAGGDPRARGLEQ